MGTKPQLHSPGDPGEPCMYRWKAPRGDMPTSMDVEHVCPCWSGHEHSHWCPCGAYADA